MKGIKTLSSLEEFISDRTKINPFWGEAGQFALLKKSGRDNEARNVLERVYKEAKEPKSWVTTSERINGVWIEKKSEPAVNPYWIDRIEKVAKLYQETLL